MTAKQFDHLKQLARNLTPAEMADVCHHMRNALAAGHESDEQADAVQALATAAAELEDLARSLTPKPCAAFDS